MKFVAIAAASLDGFITRGDEPGTAFTSKADKDWFSQTMQEFPVKILGRKTFETSRDFILERSQSEDDGIRYVLTRNPSKFQAWHKVNRLEFTDKNPLALATILKERQHHDTRVAILGGGTVYSAFLNSGLLDEFWITLEAKLFGSGTPITTEPSLYKLTLKETLQLGPSTLLLKYKC